MTDPIIDSLRAALEARPDDTKLRIAVARRLLESGDLPGAMAEAAEALRHDPGCDEARDFMLAALAPPAPAAPDGGAVRGSRTRPGQGGGHPDAAAGGGGGAAAGGSASGGGSALGSGPAAADQAAPAPAAADGAAVRGAHTRPEQGGGHPDVAAGGGGASAGGPPSAEGSASGGGSASGSAPDGGDGSGPGDGSADGSAAGEGFDWSAAEQEVGDLVGPRFVDGSAEDPGAAEAFETERPKLRLADVGGMEAVKDRLEVAFLAPMRNPELRRLYGKSLRGGLLLYGPPGCGKTFIARAVAGELGAHFIVVGISEVLDMYIGQSEHNLHELFAQARRNAPCVLFLDEIDALGQKRSQTRNSATRGIVNQLLTELDSVTSDNEGVFVLAATNQPWDVDSALRRPGRFDRTVLVLPPDAPARTGILDYHLRERPVERIELAKLVAATDGFSGADLAHLCETAAEKALIDSSRSGVVRMIGMADFEAALLEVRPSTGPWFGVARGVAMFANEGGAYDDLVAYFNEHPDA